MIYLLDLQNKLDGTRELLLEKLSHPYLLEHVESPFIDDDRLLLLTSLMEQQEVNQEKAKNYTVTTMLLQIALDTHEQVHNSQPGEEDESHKRRQLTVLAGIYFSGLYYKLLADMDDIEMIKLLASGVKEVNEQKILLYQKEAEAIDKLMESVKLIESALLGKVADHLDASEWFEFASNWLFVKRLLSEETKFIKSGSSLVFNALKKIALPKMDQSTTDLSSEQQKYLLTICTRYIEFSMTKINAALKKLPGMNSLLMERLDLIAGQHQTMSKKFAEEG
ncbi:heptaprenyl diphosphate synthase component 1 [Mesobacillus jeotgali]|uniref:heptaprenyl diphosphate synthase component 1 n=1 Tax=Mesobacillus jeotgali TaxID=129985 RepID=UPI00222758D5|nr:heptaprenyl diphosphate synthase component 1 [Mesobacillus jeotgali]UYZ20576.1 heptaprenyl diphosphate synthase component 1 [Mesobacillus jeotgali]